VGSAKGIARLLSKNKMNDLFNKEVCNHSIKNETYSSPAKLSQDQSGREVGADLEIG